MTRRRLLRLAAVLGVGIGGGALGINRWQEMSEPVRRLQRHFAHLDLDEAAVVSYLTDYERFRGPLPKFAWPDDIYTRFLLSTTFFLRDGGETRRVSYVAFYDPAVTPCFNPLARFD